MRELPSKLSVVCHNSLICLFVTISCGFEPSIPVKLKPQEQCWELSVFPLQHIYCKFQRPLRVCTVSFISVHKII